MVDDDNGDDFHSPEPKTDSRSALPGKNRRLRQLRIIKCDESFSLIFFLHETEDMELELRSVEVQGGHEIGWHALQGGAPCLVDRPWPPWCISFAQKSLLIPKSASVDFQDIPRTSLFYTENNIMAVLLKTASVRVSFIQIMQVRVQNKGKSVWKSRYVGDVSVSYQV